MSFLLTIPRRFVASIFLVLALATLTFFALTRTEVGRDVLRTQIERQFAQHFDGTLSIGELRGNLIHDVFASDVVLRDSDGRVVARIDSAFFRPHWRDLLLRTINSGRIELYRPDVQVTFDEAGPNLLRIFRVDPRSEDVPATWSFHSADVRIIDGRISSSNEGFADPQIERGNVFDYSRFRADEIDGRFLVEIGSGPTLLNVRSLSVNLHNPDFGVSDLSGQVSITSSDIELSSVQVTAGGSVARLHAVIPTKSTSRIELAIPSAEIDCTTLISGLAI